MINTVQNYPILNIPYLYKQGLVIQNSTGINGTLNPQRKLSVLAGACRDSTDTIDIRFGDLFENIEGITTSAPVRIDNAINGAGGLDQGQVQANTMYAIYIIADSSGYLPISAIATGLLNIYGGGPLMPSGYDSNRIIGFWATASDTTWLKGNYSGTGNYMTFTYDVPQITSVSSGTSNSYVPINLFATVPLIDNTPVSIYTVFNPGAAGDILTLANGISTATGGQAVITGQVASVNVTTISNLLAQNNLVVNPPLPMPAIQYKVSGTDTVAIYVSGFSITV